MNTIHKLSLNLITFRLLKVTAHRLVRLNPLLLMSKAYLVVNNSVCFRKMHSVMTYSSYQMLIVSRIAFNMSRENQLLVVLIIKEVDLRK